MISLQSYLLMTCRPHSSSAAWRGAPAVSMVARLFCCSRTSTRTAGWRCSGHLRYTWRWLQPRNSNGHVPAIPLAATEPVHCAANHALDIATYTVRQRGSANDVRALHHRTPYNITASRAYNAGKNELPHHVDALGNWVVLFSFGLTVDFYVGHKTVCVESGDALVFNGAAAHGVVHGFTHAVRLHSRPTAGRRARSSAWPRLTASG